MTQNPMDGKAKLRLKNTDTNRFKVETGSMPVIKPAAPPPARSAETPEATQTISDPLSLRDTATGKLKRITDTQTSASALAPSQVTPTGDTPQKTETVRLKVVRSSAKPGVNLGASAPGAGPVLPPTPGINAATLKLGDRAAPLPPALKSTGRMLRLDSQDAAPSAAPQPAEAAPPALKVTAPEAPAAAEAPAAPATPAAAPKSASPTIKINIMRPGAAAAKPASEPAAAPEAPAPEAPAPAAPEAAAAPGASTLKIRPVTPGATPAPASQSASATVKLTPPPSTGAPKPASTLKLSLKKDPAPPAATPEAEPEQAGTTQAVPPPAEAKKGGLKIKTGDAKPLSSAATQALPLPPSTAPAAGEAKAPAPEAAAAAASAPEPAAVSQGPGAVEAIAAIAACAALITSAVRIVLDLMQQF
ncbi:MAG: hypothetical protein ACOX6W_02290 [Lentisphaeria bacterium]|jgi:hypothetical protein